MQKEMLLIQDGSGMQCRRPGLAAAKILCKNIQKIYNTTVLYMYIMYIDGITLQCYN